jgi:hypothetical protein
VDKEKEKEKDIDIDFSELNIPYIERYLDTHKKQIIDSITDRIFRDSPKKIKPSRDDFDRLVNELTRDIHFGTMIQFALARTLLYSLWCGYQSQTLGNDPSVDFKDEYIEQIQDVINKAFNTGRNYANEIAA